MSLAAAGGVCYFAGCLRDRAEPSRFSAGENDIEGIESAITTLEERLLTADAFDNILDDLLCLTPWWAPRGTRSAAMTASWPVTQELVSRLSTRRKGQLTGKTWWH